MAHTHQNQGGCVHPHFMNDDAAEFLRIATDYQLGALETEGSHPFTVSLSQLAQDDVREAVRLTHLADILALQKFADLSAPLEALATSIGQTLEAGRRVFLCGCGATGRLSLSLEIFARRGIVPVADPERVVAFMAGGDLALIKAIEAFEDHPEYGARQLDCLGFADGDLLISTTEGGETPFVIGATERAAEISSNPPWFLYCNPDTQLIATVERSRRVLANPHIRKYCLAVGPMAITGSTRMQASTVLMAAVGFAFLHAQNPVAATTEPLRLLTIARTVTNQFLVPFILEEAAIYQRGGHVLYESDRFGITVVTDTTERAPTFSLAPFENQTDPDQPASWCHFIMPDQPDAIAAWRALLGREPRTLDWPGIEAIAGTQALNGYDFSAGLLQHRLRRLGPEDHELFVIEGNGDSVRFHLGDHDSVLRLTGMTEFHRHLIVKMALNIHSTLVMGRMGRYLDNLMTFVKPSNNKLIDRAARYVQTLMERRTGRRPSYEKTVRALFEVKKTLKVGDPVVLRTLEKMLAEATAPITLSVAS